jgi:hypothetical protein
VVRDPGAGLRSSVGGVGRQDLEVSASSLRTSAAGSTSGSISQASRRAASGRQIKPRTWLRQEATARSSPPATEWKMRRRLAPVQGTEADSEASSCPKKGRRWPKGYRRPSGEGSGPTEASSALPKGRSSVHHVVGVPLRQGLEAGMVGEKTGG